MNADFSKRQLAILILRLKTFELVKKLPSGEKLAILYTHKYLREHPKLKKIMESAGLTTPEFVRLLMKNRPK